MMKAIDLTNFGGTDSLKIESIPCPQIEADEVLIKVSYAGINRPDIVQRQGFYPPPAGASHIMGLEISGKIVEIGKNVKNWKIGEKVCALLPGGGYAEYAKAHQNCILPIPKSLDLCQAAALPETSFTVWSNIFDQGKLQNGETFLIHGGTSGIGTIAIQLAKAFGAKVIATAGSEKKCQSCLSLGADLAIFYKKEDFVEKVLKFTNQKGADVILDIVGGDYVNKNYKAAAQNGRILQIAFLNGNQVSINLNYIMRKSLLHTGSTLRNKNNQFKGKIRDQIYQKMWPLIEAQKIRPIIDSIFEMEDIAKAHQKMETSLHIGKIMLKISSD